MAIVTTALAWLPILLFELTSPYSLGHFFVSPVLARGFAVAALVWCSLVLTIGFVSSLGSLVLFRGARRPMTPAGIATAVLVSSWLSVSQLDVGHRLAEGWQFAPETGAFAVIVLASIVGALAPFVVRFVLPARWAGTVEAVGFLSSLALWLWLVDVRFRALVSPDRLAIVLPATAALVLFVIATGTSAGNGVRRRVRLAYASPCLGIVLSLAALAYSSSITRPAIGGTRPAAPNAAAAESMATDEPVNVVVIMVDTLRADHTTVAGYEQNTTPVLEGLLSDRTTHFVNAAAAASSTIPSVKSFFTGHLPSHAGEEKGNLPPPPGSWTMPRAFRESGYFTAGFSANGLIDGAGFTVGFDDFLAFGGHTYVRRSYLLSQVLWGSRSWDVFRRTRTLHLHKETAPGVRKLHRQWLERSPKQPFFLYVHLVDPHWPYYDRGFGFVSDELRDLASPHSFVDLMLLSGRGPRNAALRTTPEIREVRARYDSEIHLADQIIGEMLADLAALGVEDSTLVVVVSDHGEEFFEHNGFGHGHDVYQEQVHVPFVIRWPKDERFANMPKRVDVPVSLMDVLPTLTDYLALSPPPGPVFGRSLRPLLESDGQVEGHPVLSESLVLQTWRRAYREGDLKVRLNYSPSIDLATAEDVQVFDLRQDPGEQRPLSLDDPRLETLLERARRAPEQIGDGA